MYKVSKFCLEKCIPKKTTQSLKTEPRIKKGNRLHSLQKSTHVRKWPVIKYKYIKIKPRICVLFILCLTWTVNAKSSPIHPTKVAAKNIISLITSGLMFCFNEFAFTAQVKQKINSIQILGFILIYLYFTTGHFLACVLCKECSQFSF